MGRGENDGKNWSVGADRYEFSLTRTFGPAENQIDFDEFQMQFRISTEICMLHVATNKVAALIVVLVTKKLG